MGFWTSVEIGTSPYVAFRRNQLPSRRFTRCVPQVVGFANLPHVDVKAGQWL